MNTELVNEFTFVETFSDNTRKQFDIYYDEEKVAYYVEHYVDMNTSEVLKNTLYEVYYDYNEEGEEYQGTALCDSLNECLEYLYY